MTSSNKFTFGIFKIAKNFHTEISVPSKNILH